MNMMDTQSASQQHSYTVELEAVRDLLQAIADLLEDLPVRDDGNAIERWSAAYCQAQHAADMIDSARQHDSTALGNYVEKRLRWHTIKALAARSVAECCND